jgi:hypothetical protein
MYDDAFTRGHGAGESSLGTAAESFGPCCICEGTVGVRNVLMLSQNSPTPGRGWGCVVCDLPSDGAIAVVCDACVGNAEAHGLTVSSLLRFACGGYPGWDGRVPIGQLAGTHDHDRTKHPAEDFEPGDPDDDDALATARQILSGAVCECGHLEGEHVMGEPPNECGFDGCACDQFSAVVFTVTRAHDEAV